MLLLLVFRLYLPAAVGAALMLPVFVSSVRTGRHTVPQLLGGCLIAAGCLGCLMLALPL